MRGGVWGFALAHVRSDGRRTFAAAVAIAVAVASFIVLSGAVTTEHLQITNTVQSNYRSTYDILVRATGAASELERTKAAVRPNFLTETYGGITLEQVSRISAMKDVQIAAPVAVLGQVSANVVLRVRVDQVLKGRDHAMVRFVLDGSARNATSTTSSEAGYLYLTRSELTTVDTSGSQVGMSPRLVEQRASGAVTACLASDAGGRAVDPTKVFTESCWSATTATDGTATVEALLTLPISVEAIDPVAEERLTGLSQAIVSGRALSGSDSTGTSAAAGGTLDTATAVMAASLPLDYQARLVVDELSEDTTTKVLATEDAVQRQGIVTAAQPVRTLETVTKDGARAYSEEVVAGATSQSGASQNLIALSIVQPGQVTYTGSDPVTPSVVACDPTVWASDATSYLPTPSTVCDTGYRSVSMLKGTTSGNLLSFNVVGTYDAERIEKTSGANQVPLETYRSPLVVGADDASRQALGNKPMLSDLNPTGYVQSPPALLVSLASLPLFSQHFPSLNQAAPVSSVRVRVAGVTGISDADRERIRATAEQIQQQTGLDVDITAGASLQNQAVSLPATQSGTPALVVNELWTKKGVAVQITQALDIKSVVLMALVLMSSILTVWLTATASVRARRRQLGTLACLGWSPGLRRSAILAELGMVGLGAGVLGLLLAVPTALIAHVHVSWLVWAAAIPVGLLITIVPGLAAAAAAARVAPLDAFLEPQPKRQGRWQHTTRGPIGVGVAMLAQRAARLAVGSAGVALAVISDTLVLGVAWHFHDTLIGSFLGDAVAVQARTPDLVAAGLITLLGLTAVTTLLFLQIAEDIKSFGALRAVGWSDAKVAVAISTQAAILAILGIAVGVAVALGAWLLAFHSIDGVVLRAALSVALIGAIVTLCASLVPALTISTTRIARVLSSE